MEVLVDFMKKVSSKKDTFFIPSLVLNEISWTLQRFYKVPKSKVIIFMESILAVDNFKVIYKYDFANALHLYKTVNIKLNDCLIWSFMEKDDQIVSFDKDFDKLPRIKRVEPKDLLV